ALRDIDLLVFGVTRETDDFHSIQQRGRNIERIRRRNEHPIGEVVSDLDVMIDERVVLFRIEHFEQRAGRVAAEIHAHLVDFVEQKERIAYGDLRQVLKDLTE